MSFEWDKTFGREFFIRLTNEERRYFGLNPMCDAWESTCFVSSMRHVCVRTTVFWNGDEIRKVVTEDIRFIENADYPVSCYYSEFDTRLQTQDREMILPLTTRGKPKKVTPTNINAVIPFGCTFWLAINDIKGAGSARMGAFNSRNMYFMAIGETERIEKIRDDESFHQFMEYYMATCPEGYFDRVEHMRTAPHQTVRYRNGDIFRVEIDRFRYGYGLITGQIREIRKWPELPAFHSFRGLMTVPLMIRFYRVVTERPDMTAEELSKMPLDRVRNVSDGDVIWGKTPIIGHKTLTEEDVEFPLVCTRTGKPNAYNTTHTDDFFFAVKALPTPEVMNLYVEWGTATVRLPFDGISPALAEFLKAYRDPHGGVKAYVFPEFAENPPRKEKNLLDPESAEMRRELFRCLGLDPDAGFDDFARAFGGMTKKETVERLNAPSSSRKKGDVGK